MVFVLLLLSCDTVEERTSSPAVTAQRNVGVRALTDSWDVGRWKRTQSVCSGWLNGSGDSAKVILLVVTYMESGRASQSDTLHLLPLIRAAPSCAAVRHHNSALCAYHGIKIAFRICWIALQYCSDAYWDPPLTSICVHTHTYVRTPTHTQTLLCAILNRNVNVNVLV